MSDTNTAAIVAALETLGAEIVAQRGETQWYADRAAANVTQPTNGREHL